MTSRSPRALALLLTYPQADLIKALPDVQKILANENWLSRTSQDAVAELIVYMQSVDLLDLQAEYVELFDRTPSLDLNLFEHIHGDSRKRGQALVDLNAVYEEAGLFNDTVNTPDFLPLFLEYLSVLPLEKARDDLNGAINVIAILGERLQKRESPYAGVFVALTDMASCAPDKMMIQKALKEDSGRPMTPEEMDDAWEEQFAFGDNMQTSGSGCPKAEEMLARINEG